MVEMLVVKSWQLDMEKNDQTEVRIMKDLQNLVVIKAMYDRMKLGNNVL